MQSKPIGSREPPFSMQTAVGNADRCRLRILLSMHPGDERQAIQKVLLARGYEVFAFGRVGVISAIERVWPGIVFVDNLDTLDQIRRHPEYQDMPTVVIVDKTDQDLFEAYQAGADVCFTRPLDLEDPFGVGGF